VGYFLFAYSVQEEAARAPSSPTTIQARNPVAGWKPPIDDRVTLLQRHHLSGKTDHHDLLSIVLAAEHALRTVVPTRHGPCVDVLITIPVAGAVDAESPPWLSLVLLTAAAEAGG